MPHFKPCNYDQIKMIPVSYAEQILPGTFEHTLCEVIDFIDLSIFYDRFKNEETGATAYNPAILLKIILYAYSRGINHSRKIEKCCRENVMFMALSADSHPDHSTIATFVSGMHQEILFIFQSVLRICMELELVDGTMFAVDGCKLSSNASKEWSGTKADLRKKRDKLKAALDHMIKSHIKKDKKGECSESDKKTILSRIEKAKAKVEKLDRWLDENEDKMGKRGRARQSNITDNESAKMKSSHGVIQGYNGLAVVDETNQVIIHAEAHGNADDGSLLPSCIEGAKENLRSVTGEEEPLKGTQLTADTAFHTIDNCEFLEEEGIDGYVPDCNFRKRDPRFASANRFKGSRKKKSQHFEQKDFIYNKKTDTYTCPQGHPLRFYQECLRHNGMYTGRRYRADHSYCLSCKVWSRCLKGKEPHPRTLMIISGTRTSKAEAVVRMREKVDTHEGRELYSRRMGIVEPVFGNIRSSKRLDRFTLRSRVKVNIQWLLYSLVHNIGKIWRGPVLCQS